MTDVLKRISRGELRRLKPGDWVAWGKSNWDNNPVHEDFAFWEAQVVDRPVRSAQHVLVLFSGHSHEVTKNQLFRVMPIIDVQDMHQQFDYNC
jgi:hypothetical protein